MICEVVLARLLRSTLFSVILSATLLTAEPRPQPQPFDRPLVFEPNHGQAPASVKWLARASGYQILFTAEGATMVLREPEAEAPGPTPMPVLLQPYKTLPISSPSAYTAVRMKLTGGHPWRAVTGLEPTGGTSNYFLGSDPKHWHTDIPHYVRLRASSVYEGIDMVFYSDGGDLEYDFVVAPGADPKQIRLAFDGIDSMRVDRKSGDLLLMTAGGTELRHVRPTVYQQLGAQRMEVAGGYEILDHRQATFLLADYDHRRRLVIDPTIKFTVFLAGSDQDRARGVAVDGSGNAYVTGYTNSTNFPQLGSRPDTARTDAFVTKLSPSGTIMFSTTLVQISFS